MLNELYIIQRGLEKVGEIPAIKHNDIKEPGMGTTFRILLAANGNVSRVEWLNKEKLKDVWSIGNGKKNQFPAIKLAFPLIPDAHRNYKEWKENNNKPKEKAYREFINKQISQHSLYLGKIAFWPSYRNKILERKEQFNKNYKDKNFYQIFERYSKSENNGINILLQVYELTKEAVNNVDLKVLSAISDVLFGAELNNKGIVKDGKRVTFLLDANPSNDIDYYSSSKREIPALSKALFDLESDRTGEKSVCALTGNECNVVEKVFPEVKLNVVGSTILYTKNSGTSGPTVKRYGYSGAKSYPVSDELSKKLAASIAFLASEKYQGITWSKIPSTTGSSPSLLLAYCKDDLSLAVSRLITGNSDIEDFEDYQDATRTVLDLFDKSNCTPDAIVEIAEIIVLDKANRKINYSTTSSLGGVRQAADEWSLACRNTPDFKLFSQIGNSKKLLGPWLISPVKICYLSRSKYIRNGESSTPIPAISFSDTMKLFFSQNHDLEQLASRLLVRLSNQFELLISRCALSKTHSELGQDARLKTNPKNNTQALNAVTVMSALLYKLGRKKEVYMNDFAYQLGQFCSAVDELHIGYCKSMRGGDIPNTLIGNLTYGMALQSPTKALAVLASRIKPYETWARNPKNFSSNDKAIKTGIYAHKWLSGQSEKIYSHFADNNPSVTDSFKAELMLGYLAGRPFEGKREPQSNSNEAQGEE